MIDLVVMENRGALDGERALIEAIDRARPTLIQHLITKYISSAPSAAAMAVQRTLERVTFLRLCEDRGVERSGSLLAASRGNDIHGRLGAAIRRLDAKYALRFGESDPLTELPEPRLVFDDDVLSAVLRAVGEVRSESPLSGDTLGRVYERFLAAPDPSRPGWKTVRKSLGVYYTPRRVVDYVVSGVLGRLLLHKTPEEAMALRVLDPACGSGFFLLGAYRYLLDWHRAFYLGDGDRHRRGPAAALRLDSRGDWQLTAAKRREILQSSIFGVDVDPKAVEVTRLSLLLTALETERHEANAPLDLGRNLQCGDSLIEEDIGGSSSFDWKTQFPDVFAGGGFDAVIGNPPYVSYGGRQGVPVSPARAAYFERSYESAGWATAHSFFMERAAKLLSKRFVSFIVPDQVGHLDGYRSLRGVLLRHGGLAEVKYWGEKVFEGVTTPALSFVWDKKAAGAATRVRGADDSEQVGPIRGDATWSIASSRTLLDKLRARSVSIRPWLADCGLRTTNAKKQVIAIERASRSASESRPWLPTLEGKQVGRYWCAPPQVGVRLDAGDVYKSKDDKYDRARFLIRQTAAYPIVGPREHVTHFRNSLHALYQPNNGLDVRYCVGLLNSKVLRFAYVKTIREARQKAFPQVKLGPLGQLPIRSIDLATAADRAAHDRIVDIVEALLTAHRLLQAGGPHGGSLRRQAADLDASLDAEVYRLYDLDGTDIAEVEATLTLVPIPPRAP
jgi:hypothetical protein